MYEKQKAKQKFAFLGNILNASESYSKNYP